MPPTAQRSARCCMNSGNTPGMKGKSWHASQCFISGAGSAVTDTCEGLDAPKLPWINVTTCPFCIARLSTWLTALPSRNTSTSKLTGTSGSTGPTKVIASERTGRSAGTFARMASYCKAATRPPKLARPCAHPAGIDSSSGCRRTASSRSQKRMKTSEMGKNRVGS
ncbi:hypothetical protein D3C85_1478640 [compost metagenome]